MSMNPVVLMVVPNLPYLLGTFDTTSFRTWWRSNAFPDAIETITKGFHIYGRTHLAIAQRTDGYWAVYRSKNYGIDWERAFLAASGEKVYDLVLITYGRAIMNTSTGFYETVNAGKSWTKIASLPGASAVPAFCNIGGGDVLLCTDGRYIWRSTDIARHWTLVCDAHTILFGSTSSSDDPSGSKYKTYYTNTSKACIAGACGRVFAAAGPFLLISEDAGLTFKGYRRWMGDARYDTDWSDLAPPHSLVAGRLWPVPSSPPFIITQILVTSIDGATGADVQFLVRYNDLQLLSGESVLYSRVFTTYGASGHIHGVYMGNAWFKYVFQQLVADYDATQITSYSLPVTGAAYTDQLIFSAQTTTDSSGNQVIALKYSTDGGVTWTVIDASKISVGSVDAALAVSSAGASLDDNFAKLTWVAGGCCNYGSWDYTELYRRQCLSYEMDAKILAAHSKSYNADVNVSLDKQITEDVDAIVANPKKTLDYDVDAMVEGQVSKSYLIDRTLEGLVSKEQEVDAILSIDHEALDTVDAHVWANLKKYYKVDVLFKSRRSQTYNVDVIIVEDELNQTMQDMVSSFVQFMDLVDPGIPYGVYNSKETA